MESKIEIEKFNKITEEDVGITQYMNDDNKGFKCVLKHRYSDFLVNEIDTNNNVVWLKTDSNEFPNNPIKEEKKELTEELASTIIKEQFPSLMSHEDSDKVSTLITKYLNKQNCVNDKVEIAFIPDKKTRTKFHETLRDNFPFLDSETVENKETKQKKLVVSYMSTQSMYKRRKVFPDKSKNVLHFSMLKRNMDTVTAINYISRMLHRSAKSIKFCGNKDKRGITTQRISLFNTLPSEVMGAIKSKKWSNAIEIDNFSLSDTELRLGLLKGNQFCVALRFIEGITPEELQNVVSGIDKLGFINYFGMQRFGINNIPTHLIGKKVIMNKWKDVFVLILSTAQIKDALNQIDTDSEVNSIEDVFEITDSKKQMSIINNLTKIIPKFTTESKLLCNYYKSGKNSFESSFRCLNKQLQVLYPHAYQSYIWNLSVSYRLTKYGKKIVIGDIVKKHAALYEEKNQEEDCEDINEEENNSKLKEEEDNDAIFNNNFEYITEENINKFTFDDVVMPIVGYKIHYPKNEVTNYIESLLEKDGLTFKDFESQCVNFNSTGYFRKIVEKPIKPMSIEIVHHDDPDEDLQNEYYNIEQHPSPKGTKYTSARITFQLPQSTYATMLFRELTKKSSAGNYQANLSLQINNENNREKKVNNK